ncbi:Glu/Leu/Phe/Val family dehydrogenase [Sphingomonas sp. ID0503]|uniref:Glu/Leu/Phe/Val family dehydrogenase n=1 Tax=Sphingomonas sp. ID0503 TaxID=3399691 RepID=UPI003AFB7D42
MTPWDYPDFDDHEGVHLFRDPAAGLTAIIAVHSTHLGPGSGGVRFWHYADRDAAITDALRLSRGMSYKNAMAGLPAGGAKGVILADANHTKTPELLAAFARAVDSLGGRYITAQDVGVSADDMVALSKGTRFVSGLPPAEGQAGGDPGPSTALGVFLGVKAAVNRALGTDRLEGIHVAIQGVGSVGGGLARHLAGEGARITIADVDQHRAETLAAALGAEVLPVDQILSADADVFSPCALGAVLNEASIPTIRAPIVAGAANNQLATPEDGQRLHDRGILYAPDYVINAGGIINVVLEYAGQGSAAEVEARVAQIPSRLYQVWDESSASGEPAAVVADRLARELIGRA